jgi:hypothetical protein
MLRVLASDSSRRTRENSCLEHACREFYVHFGSDRGEKEP